MTPTGDNDANFDTTADLARACAFWQAGQTNSSLLRAGARVITGIPHYFSADFIHAYEDQVRQNPAALADASVLLDALAVSPPKTPSQWASVGGLADTGFAGRGLKPNGEKDDQIERRLDEGVIEMPLWGVTLDREVTEHYGTRFLLEIVEPFPAIPAWMQSDTKPDEQELITGGIYKVLSAHRARGRTHARLRWTGPSRPHDPCDETLHSTTRSGTGAPEPGNHSEPECPESTDPN